MPRQDAWWGKVVFWPEYGNDAGTQAVFCLMDHVPHIFESATDYTLFHNQACRRVVSARTCSLAAASLTRLRTRSPSLLEAQLVIEQSKLSIWCFPSTLLADLSITNRPNTDRKVRRGRMCPRRCTISRTVGGRREEMEHIPTHNRRTESQGEESRTVEPVPAQESLQRGSRLLEFGVWVDGRIYGEV